MTYCLLCEKILLATATWQGLLKIKKEEKICKRCSKTFKRADIEDKSTYLSSIQSIYTYNDAMQTYLHQFKFLRDYALAAVFQEEIRKALLHKANVVPIPIHRNKLMERTFAHVDALLDCAQIAYEQPLEKINETTMSEKTKAERLQTPALFQLKEGAVVKRQSYVLFDDIYTTGTTLNHAAKVLLQAGAEDVEAVTLIRA